MQRLSPPSSLHTVIANTFMSALNRQLDSMWVAESKEEDEKNAGVATLAHLKQIKIELQALSDGFAKAFTELEPFFAANITNNLFTHGDSDHARRRDMLKSLIELFHKQRIFISVVDLLFTSQLTNSQLRDEINLFKRALATQDPIWLDEKSTQLNTTSRQQLKAFALNIVEAYTNYFNLRDQYHNELNNDEQKAFNEFTDRTFITTLKSPRFRGFDRNYLKQLMTTFFESPEYQDSLYNMIVDEQRSAPGSVNLITRPLLKTISHRTPKMKIALTDVAMFLPNFILTTNVAIPNDKLLLKQIPAFYGFVEAFQKSLSVLHGKDAKFHKAQEIIPSLKSFPAALALYHVCQPDVNSHDNLLQDLALGISNTNLWQQLLSNLRDKATALAIADSKKFATAADKLAYLEWLNRFPLIQKHRANFAITGAYGKTTAVKTIKIEIDRIYASLARHKKILTNIANKDLLPDTDKVQGKYFNKQVVDTQSVLVAGPNIYMLKGHPVNADATTLVVREATDLESDQAVLMAFYPLGTGVAFESPYYVEATLRNQLAWSADISDAIPNTFIQQQRPPVIITRESGQRFLCVIAYKPGITLEKHLTHLSSDLANVTEIQALFLKLFTKQAKLIMNNYCYTDNNFENIYVDENDNPLFSNTAGLSKNQIHQSNAHAKDARVDAMIEKHRKQISQQSLEAMVKTFMTEMPIKLHTVFSKLLKTQTLNQELNQYIDFYVPIIADIISQRRTDLTLKVALDDLFANCLYLLTKIKSPAIKTVHTPLLMIAYFENFSDPNYQQELFREIMAAPSDTNLKRYLSYPAAKNVFSIPFVKDYSQLFFTYALMFRQQFPAVPNNNSLMDAASRAKAIKTVNNLLLDADNFAAAHALYQVCKLHINLHTNETIDAYIGKQNCQSWQTILITIRDKALQTLLDVKSLDDVNLKLDFLEFAKQTAIVTEHRNNFIVTGAFGSTTALKLIDNEIKKITAAESQYAKALNEIEKAHLLPAPNQMTYLRNKSYLAIAGQNAAKLDLYELFTVQETERLHLHDPIKTVSISKAVQLSSAQSVAIITYPLASLQRGQKVFAADQVAAQWNASQALNDVLPGTFITCLKKGELPSIDPQQHFYFVMTPYLELTLEDYLNKSINKPVFDEINHIISAMLINQVYLMAHNAIYTDGDFRNIVLNKNRQPLFMKTSAIAMSEDPGQLQLGFNQFLQSTLNRLEQFFKAVLKTATLSEDVTQPLNAFVQIFHSPSNANDIATPIKKLVAGLTLPVRNSVEKMNAPKAWFSWFKTAPGAPAAKIVITPPAVQNGHGMNNH